MFRFQQKSLKTSKLNFVDVTVTQQLGGFCVSAQDSRRDFVDKF